MSTIITANNNRIAKNTLLLYFRMVIVLLISLYTTRALFRVLGVSDYGIYNVVSGFVALFGFLNTAMANGIQRFYNFTLGKRGEEGLTSIYNTSLRIQLLISIVVFLLLEVVGIWYINNNLVLPHDRLIAANYIFQYSSISLLFVIFQAPFSGAIMAMERMDYFALVSILDAVFKLAFVILLQILPADKLIVWGSVGLLIAIIDFLLYFVYCKKHFEFIRLTKTYNKNEFKSMLSFSGWNVFGTLSNMLKDQGVNIILNSFFGPVVNAARGIATQISGALSHFVSNNNIAVRPQLTQSYAQGNYSRTTNLMFAISKLNYFLLLIMTVPFCFEIEFILHLWLGDGVPADVPIFAILVMATNLMENLRSPVSLVVHASGKMKKYQFWVSIANLLTLPLSWFALNIGANPESTFIIALCCSLLAQVVAILIIKTIVNLCIKEYFVKVVFPCLTVTLLSAMATFFTKLLLHAGMLSSILVITGSALITMVISFFIGMNSEEKNIAKSMAHGIINKIKKNNSV